MQDEELRAIRRELALLERGPGKRYREELRVRIVAWARRRVREGESLTASADAVALHPRTLAQWMGATGDSRQVALVPVEVVDEPPEPATPIRIVSPSGYRLEGLTFDEALRALARLR